MASSYFTIPSFNRAKKNKEDLEKTNPQEPVLKDEDEKFFDKEMRSGPTSEGAKEAPATKITDDGEEKPLTTEEKESTIESEDQTVVPENRPDSGVAQEDTGSGVAQEEGVAYDDKQKEQAATAVKERKEKKKNKGMQLPSQEDAEAATRGFNRQSADAQQGEKTQGEKKTWASYLPSVRSKRPQSSGTGEQTPPSSAGGTNADAEKKDGTDDSAKADEDNTSSPKDTQQPRTWTQYATSYVPSMPTFKSKKLDADSAHTPIYNPDGSINEAATAEKQEREVSVLLDNLNLSSINNRVFSFSADTQRLYERFLLCLKDVVNGAPTAYEDMDKLMKEAGPKLEEQWKTMPPFVQTLVKSLPMRLGPELAAVATENPNDELKKSLQSASKSGGGGGGGGAGVAAAAMREGGGGSGGDVEAKGKEGEKSQKQKRRVPGLKSLVSGQGTIATMLRNTVAFIQTRFPFLASTTNVVMSLAVFILMFVFWYCHKRGKEVRLAREAGAAGSIEGEADSKTASDADDGAEISDSAEDSDVEEMVEELEKADVQAEQEAAPGSSSGVDAKTAVLNQPAPSEVPLPGTGTAAEKEGGEEEAQKEDATAST